MHLAFYCLWTPGMIFIAVLFLRGFHCSCIPSFPFFYAYIASVALADTLGLLVLLAEPSLYRRLYWIEQFVTLVVGCGLIVEIFDHVLFAYPGAKKLARRLCVSIFATILASGFAYANLIHPENLSVSEIQLERDIRCAQIILFVAVVAVVYYYRIPLTRTTNGMIQGYGIYLGVSLASLALRSYVGPRFTAVWNIAQPMSFDLALFVWVIAFWAYEPSAALRGGASPDSDYDALAVFTRSRIAVLRSHIARAMRS